MCVSGRTPGGLRGDMDTGWGAVLTVQSWARCPHFSSDHTGRRSFHSQRCCLRLTTARAWKPKGEELVAPLHLASPPKSGGRQRAADPLALPECHVPNTWPFDASLTGTGSPSPQLHRPFPRQHHHPIGPDEAPVPVLPQQTPHVPVAVGASPGDPVQQ